MATQNTHLRPLLLLVVVLLHEPKHLPHALSPPLHPAFDLSLTDFPAARYPADKLVSLAFLVLAIFRSIVPDGIDGRDHSLNPTCVECCKREGGLVLSLA